MCNILVDLIKKDFASSGGNGSEPGISWYMFIWCMSFQ